MAPSVRSFPAALPVLLLLAACGSDGIGPRQDPSDGDRTPTGAVTGTIAPDGGSLTVVTDDGARITLTVPADAVRAATDVTLRPLAPADGYWARVALEPAGLIFRRPFTLAVRLPEDVELADPALVLGTGEAPLPLATAVDREQRTLTTSALSFFGFVDGGATPGGGAFATGRASRAGDNSIGARRLSCQQIVATAQAEFDGFLALGLHMKAIGAALSAEAALQNAECTDAVGLLEPAAATACDQLGAVIDAMLATPISTHGEFQRNTIRLLDWFALVQSLTDDCGAVDRVGTAIDQEIADFLRFFTARLDGVTGVDYAAYQDLREEARDLEGLAASLYALGAADAAAAVEAQTFVPAVQAMRPVAYRLCRDQGWHYPMSRLMPAGFYSARDIIGVTPPRPGPIVPPHEYAGLTAETVAADLQYCGTDLTLEAADTAGAVVATARAGTDGGPGLYTAGAALDVPVDGSLRISGELTGFTCWDNAAADTEIIVLLDRTAVHTLARPGTGPYLDGAPVELDMGEIAERAGVPLEPGDTHELVLRRHRTACDARLWGPAEFDLVTAALTMTGTPPVRWTFDSGLDGWVPGTTSGAGSGGRVSATGGMAVLEGFEEPGVPNAWISHTVELSPEAQSLSFRLRAGCAAGNDGDTMLRVRLAPAGLDPVTLLDWFVIPESSQLQERSASLGAYAGQTVTLFFEQSDEGEQQDDMADAESACIDEVVIS